jgi:hypothetical protein
MKMQNLTYYIGQNNITKKAEYQKAINTTKLYFEGFNINKNQIGIWKGDTEKSFSISIIQPNIDLRKADKLKAHLKEILQQQSILKVITKIDAEF